MTYKYIVRTSIPRNFDPEVEGLTLDSIAETCPGYVKHSIPGIEGLTRIHITLNRPIEGESESWLVGQLEAEFAEGGKTIVLGIDEDGG